MCLKAYLQIYEYGVTSVVVYIYRALYVRNTMNNLLLHGKGRYIWMFQTEKRSTYSVRRADGLQYQSKQLATMVHGFHLTESSNKGQPTPTDKML